MEAARFERNVRTESSEIFTIYGGARRVGRVDIHYGRFEVHGTLLLEVDLTDDELQQLIDQLDEELVQTHDPELEQQIRQAKARETTSGDACERRESVGDTRVLSAKHVAASGLATVEHQHDAARNVVDVNEVQARVGERHERQSTAREVAHQSA